MLQKMAEIMEYHELLDKAAACEVRTGEAKHTGSSPP